MRRGLLQDDSEYDRCLEEAATFGSPRSLRQLFAQLLLHCTPTEPELLWAKHRDALSEDILYRLRQVILNVCNSLHCIEKVLSF